MDKSNRAYVLTHGDRGIEWSNYRHPLPEHVYDVYMQFWKDTQFAAKQNVLVHQLEQA